MAGSAGGSGGNQTFIGRPGFIFDTETTGVSPASDRIVELGAVLCNGGQIVDERKVRINPGCPIPAGASAIHGITDADVAGKPPFAAVAPRFLAYLEASGQDGEHPWLAGYNATQFDVPLINAELERAGLSGSLDAGRVVDPIVFVRWHLRHLQKRSLENVCAHFGIKLAKAHSALADARATCEVLFHLVQRGMIPESIDAALAEQARLSALLAEENQSYAYWLYHDRSDGRLRLGAGRYIGYALADVGLDYLRSLLDKIEDLPEAVRLTFTARLTVSRPAIAAVETRVVLAAPEAASAL